MPSYTFKNTKTGETFDDMMSYDDSLKFLEDNPDFEKDITQAFPAMHSGRGLGFRKPDEAFKDLLGNIQKNNKGGKTNNFR